MLERFEEGEGEEEAERVNGSIALEDVMLAAAGGGGNTSTVLPYLSAAPVRYSNDLFSRPGRLKLELK